MSAEGNLDVWTGLTGIGCFLLTCIGWQNRKINKIENKIEDDILTKDKHHDLCTIKDLEVDVLILESEKRIIKAIETAKN